jgi:uroporphyrinogen decarboxylase
MNSEQRLLAALKREPVDRVPTFEWWIDQKVIDAIIPGGIDYAEFSDRMDLDAICVDPDYKSVPVGDGFRKNEWGIVSKNTGEAHTYPVDGPLRTPDDLKAFTPPDPKAPERYKSLEGMLDKYGDRRAIIFHVNDVWSIPSRLMPFEEFIMQVIDEPEFIRDIVEMTVDVNIELARQAKKRGVKVVYTGDDFAYVNGPMISPAMFEDIFAEPLNRVMGAYKEMGLMVIKHTDGNIMPIIDIIINSGIDCLDPIDPIAGMSLEHIKKTYGHRICIKGNVDCANTLVLRSAEEAAEETKHCIKIAAPGGGYILSSSNSIHSSVKPENYLAMLDALKKYGTYPIEF